MRRCVARSAGLMRRTSRILHSISLGGALLENSPGPMFGPAQSGSLELRADRHVFRCRMDSHPFTRGDASMARLAYTSILVAFVATSASAQAQQPGGSAAQIMSSIPANSETITHWYKQSVYDPNDSKIGEIMDVLVDREGKATAFIIGVGGFLGMGEKDVAVPFNAVQVTNKNNNKWYLVMNSTKDALKSAKGFKYDRSEMKWVPEEASNR
jgi:sporulation protein YlmC with PRC-barrel domain